MKIKFIAISFFVFFAHIPFVYPQVGVSQLDILQNLQNMQMIQQQQGIDGSAQSFEDDFPRDKKDSEKSEDEDDEIIEKFGYQGREDFLVAPNSKFLEKPLERFGYDYFLNDQNDFLPSKDTPIPTDYVLGPGDTVKIILFGNTNRQYALEVTREGDIFLPEIGPISIAGLTFRDAKETVNQIIDNQLISTKATMTLGNLRSINIFVLGEATKPGMYTISALSTLTNAIFSNGGIKNTGSLRNIQLKRNGELISDFDFYDFLLKGDTRNDSRLMSGDVVFIPPTQKLVGISGEVKRPGIYELKDKESAEDLLNFAGELTARADLSSLEIERIDSSANSFSLVDINLDNIEFSQLELKDGDKLSIFPITDKFNNAVLVRGHSQKPGFYPWVKGKRMSDIISNRDDMLPMTDMDYVLVKRESSSGQGYEFIQVNLEILLSDPDSKENILLNNRDEIILFPSLLDMKLIRTVLTDSDYENNDPRLSTYYVKKSIMEKGTPTLPDDNQSLSNEENPDSEDALKTERKYFHYYVYDYCVVEESLLRELLDIDTPETEEELNTLPIEDTIERKIAQGEKDPNVELTKYCRNQIIEPIMTLIEQQSSPNNPEKKVTIFGNVTFPGEYPLTQNSTVKDGLAAAGGLSGLSYTDEIDISKKRYPGKEVIEETILASANNINDIDLDPLDVITVKKLGYNLSIVNIQGEVYFPGEYPVSENESFTSLIERAGGLKQNASLKNIFFQRTSLIQSEIERFNQAQANLKKEMLLLSKDTLGSNNNYVDKILQLTEQELPDPSLLGRLIIDGQAIYKKESKDIMLMDGDRINIPKEPQTVRVIGEVYAPNSHFFEPNLSTSDYIQLSGGYNDFADSNSIYVIKQNGSVSIIGRAGSGGFFRGSSGIEAGDTIVIPVKIDTIDGLRATTEITQIIYQMALAAAAVNSF